MNGEWVPMPLYKPIEDPEYGVYNVSRGGFFYRAISLTAKEGNNKKKNRRVVRGANEAGRAAVSPRCFVWDSGKGRRDRVEEKRMRLGVPE